MNMIHDIDDMETELGESIYEETNWRLDSADTPINHYFNAKGEVQLIPREQGIELSQPVNDEDGFGIGLRYEDIQWIKPIPVFKEPRQRINIWLTLIICIVGVYLDAGLSYEFNTMHFIPTLFLGILLGAQFSKGLKTKRRGLLIQYQHEGNLIHLRLTMRKRKMHEEDFDELIDLIGETINEE